MTVTGVHLGASDRLDDLLWRLARRENLPVGAA